MTTVLSVKDLEKSFGKKQILHGITFEVKKGEILALLGPNGAGKSTTIRSVMEILYPDKGKVQFQFESSNKIVRNKIGYLPEERGLYKNVKVGDMLMYLAELKDYPKQKAKDRMYHYLDKFDLQGKENATIETLSKGMAQKIQFIGTIIHEPELLILDEPFSGLDPVSQELLQEEIRELANKGTAIILSSHQMNLVEEMCDRVLFIHQGKQMVYDSLEEVKLTHANMKCMIYGRGNDAIWDQIKYVNHIIHDGNRTTLYLENHVNMTSWVKALPQDLNIIEMDIKRVSLHEIFISIATGSYDENEGKAHA